MKYAPMTVRVNDNLRSTKGVGFAMAVLIPEQKRTAYLHCSVDWLDLLITNGAQFAKETMSAFVADFARSGKHQMVMAIDAGRAGYWEAMLSDNDEQFPPLK